jgi:hypothetical protein
MWYQSQQLLNFFSINAIPFWDMSNVPNRLSNIKKGWILANMDGTILVVYLRSIDTTLGIILTNYTGTYSVQWYNPRISGILRNGSIRTMIGGSSTTKVLFGSPPDPSDLKDWVVLLRKV